MNLSKQQEEFNKLLNNYSKIDIKDDKLIGTLSEGARHKVLKNFFEPDTTKHEVKIGNYYIDILNNDKVIEIQTRAFNMLRKKLEFLLPSYEVRLVLPIFSEKLIKWLDKDTLEIKEIRKSPRKGRVNDAFFELYKIKMFLDNPNLKISIVGLNVDEYKLLSGWNDTKKRGSRRHDVIPTSLEWIIDINSKLDYKKFIPENLIEPFSSTDYAKSSKITKKRSQVALNILRHLDIVEKVGKDGRSYLYQVNK